MNSPKRKIIKLEDVSKNAVDGVALCYGHFNIIHPGHIRYMDYASQQGTKLVVSIRGDSSFLNSDKKHHFSEIERAEGVASLEMVDQVILLGDEGLEKLVKLINPSVLVLGKEFESELAYQVNSAVKQQKKQGAKILYHAGETHYASAFLLGSNQHDLHERQKILFKQACHQQNLTPDSLLSRIDKFKNTSVLVIGDTILDQYIACDALGMSAEAPIVVVRELDTREYAGGAAVVAIHVSALGAKCHFLSVVGPDSNASLIANQLVRFNVEHTLIEDNSRPTTFKIRYLVDNQKMFRVSRLKEHSISQQIEDKIIYKLKEFAPNIQGILVSDFVYGVITPKILETILSLSKKYHIMLFGDLQCSSQVGNVSKFSNYELICPTEREARIALGTHDEGIEMVSKTLMRQTKSLNLVMKLGGDGFIAYETEKDGFVNRQHFPSLSINPVDVSGAGDSLFAALSVGLSSGATLMQSSAIGAGMASLAVQQVGNKPISMSRLKDYLTSMKQYI